jgi:short-subunit dehydrogenase
MCARRADRLGEVAKRCRAHGAETYEWITDLADPAQVDELARAALDEMGGVDILVNNAGIPKRRHVTVTDAATVDRVTQINYLAPVRLTLALLPQMLERDAGRVINVSSVAATLSSPGETAYAASKSALAVFSECMAVDLWGTGVKVLIVYPGIVDTELFSIPDNDPLDVPVEPITVDECVGMILDALDRDALEVYTPAHFKDYAVGKANNIEGFLAGTAAFVQQSKSQA